MQLLRYDELPLPLDKQLDNADARLARVVAAGRPGGKDVDEICFEDWSRAAVEAKPRRETP